MNRREHLLDITAEECNEVAQRCSKALRFGDQEVQPGQDKTNAQRIIQEFADLCAMMEMLHDEGIVVLEFGPEDLSAKKEKVEKFLEYSRQQGTLTD